MDKKIILELTNSFGSAYHAGEGERIINKNIMFDDIARELYNYTTEFAIMMVAMIKFNDLYSIIIKNFLEEDDKHDTLIIKSDIMQFLKKNNTKTHKEFYHKMCHAYKTIKMDGHRRPDEVYYQTDKGKIDEYCIHSLWEAELGDIKECTYEFSNLSNT